MINYTPNPANAGKQPQIVDNGTQILGGLDTDFTAATRQLFDENAKRMEEIKVLMDVPKHTVLISTAEQFAAIATDTEHNAFRVIADIKVIEDIEFTSNATHNIYIEVEDAVLELGYVNFNNNSIFFKGLGNSLLQAKALTTASPCDIYMDNLLLNITSAIDRLYVTACDYSIIKYETANNFVAENCNYLTYVSSGIDANGFATSVHANVMLTNCRISQIKTLGSRIVMDNCSPAAGADLSTSVVEATQLFVDRAAIAGLKYKCTSNSKVNGGAAQSKFRQIKSQTVDFESNSTMGIGLHVFEDCELANTSTFTLNQNCFIYFERLVNSWGSTNFNFVVNHAGFVVFNDCQLNGDATNIKAIGDRAVPSDYIGFEFRGGIIGSDIWAPDFNCNLSAIRYIDHKGNGYQSLVPNQDVVPELTFKGGELNGFGTVIKNVNITNLIFKDVNMEGVSGTNKFTCGNVDNLHISGVHGKQKLQIAAASYKRMHINSPVASYELFDTASASVMDTLPLAYDGMVQGDVVNAPNGYWLNDGAKWVNLLSLTSDFEAHVSSDVARWQDIYNRLGAQDQKLLDFEAKIANKQLDASNSESILNQSYTVTSVLGGRISGQGIRTVGLLGITLLSTGKVSINSQNVYDNSALLNLTAVPILNLDVQNGDVILSDGMQELTFTPYIAV